MIILQALYFFLPAYLANMAPVLIVPLLKNRLMAPIDGGATFRGHRVFGDHKTWRGLFAGIIAAILVVFLQRALMQTETGVALSLIDYAAISPLVLGLLFGLGALGGDAVKSFFKRQMGIASGQKWVPFDQLDFVVGGLLLVSIVFVPPLGVVIVLLLITPALHYLSNLIGYALKWKSNPW